MYMKMLIDEFGTDHWYQLDGYFNGGTAPWRMSREVSTAYEKKESTGDEEVPSQSRNIPHDVAWFLRGKAAYEGLSRTDPNAIWSFQGFSVVNWSSEKEASALKGFVDSVPSGKFVIIDMAWPGPGEWQKWENASFFGAPFVWTSLHNFGGTSGMKGDLHRLNRIPHQILEPVSTVFGVGGTPEGIDQNPAYYDFLFDSGFRAAPVPSLHRHMVQRSHKRYDVPATPEQEAVHGLLGNAWTLLVDSFYSNDFTTFDKTGITHLSPSPSSFLFEKDRFTPKPILCNLFLAWRNFIQAIDLMSPNVSMAYLRHEPFVFDLVNLGREVLAHISTVAAANFSDAANSPTLDRFTLQKTGGIYVELLNDVDTLVGTDTGFLLGPWLAMARNLGGSANDCGTPFQPYNHSSDCQDFFEWNARVQLTTWNPTPLDASSIPDGPIDYAAKHWNGLIRDYYGARASILLAQALKDESAGSPLNMTQRDCRFAKHAYGWTTSTNKYPENAPGNPFQVSREVFTKYKHWFTKCE